MQQLCPNSMSICIRYSLFINGLAQTCWSTAPRTGLHYGSSHFTVSTVSRHTSHSLAGRTFSSHHPPSPQRTRQSAPRGYWCAGLQCPGGRRESPCPQSTGWCHRGLAYLDKWHFPSKKAGKSGGSWIAVRRLFLTEMQHINCHSLQWHMMKTLTLWQGN